MLEDFVDHEVEVSDVVLGFTESNFTELHSLMYMFTDHPKRFTDQKILLKFKIAASMCNLSTVLPVRTRKIDDNTLHSTDCTCLHTSTSYPKTRRNFTETLFH